MSEVLVKVENVSKKFCRDLKLGLWYGVKDLTDEIFAKKSARANLRPKEFWAVNDVSFELRRGECLGLIGHNGAGKSTLLKMLNGLLKPDTGRIEMHGRVAALIELGAGFNPILTGRENIYVNGSILGFTKEQIDKKLDEIIDFAEIRDFADTAIQYYSSGMKIRLGFSIAAQLEPDVLILDEVLSVGDAGFKIKSFNKISEIIQRSAVIFVTHSMPAMSRICNAALYMRQGKLEYLGRNVNEAVGLYFENFQGEKAHIEYNKGAEIDSIEVRGGKSTINPDGIPVVKYGDDLSLDMELTIKAVCSKFDVIVQITDKDLKIIGQFFSKKVNEGFSSVTAKHRIKFRFSSMVLIDGEYSITIFVNGRNEPDLSKYTLLAVYRHYKKFRMEGLGDAFYAPIHFLGKVTHEALLPTKKLGQKA
jgi:lipopolysaccharide transport system ATP-binding protein